MDIAGYKLGREVQAGSSFTTFNALDLRRSKTVNVRIYSKELSKQKSFRSHFKTTTQMLLGQPLHGSVRIIDSFINDGACVLVTSYCPVSAVENKLSIKLGIIDILEIGRSLAKSLTQLHEMGVVHGAVELSSIHILGQKKTILGGVAIHRTYSGKGKYKPVVTSLESALYQAPEAVYGLTASTDFFSLGVLLYKLLTRENPYNAESLALLQEQKKKGKFLPLKKHLEHLQPLFNGLLAAKPQFRISKLDDLEMILNECIKNADTDNKSVRKGAEARIESTKEKPEPFGSAGDSTQSRVMMATLSFAMIPAVMAIFLLSGEGEIYQPSDVPAVLPGEPSMSQTNANVLPESDNQGNDGLQQNGFYANAEALFQAGDYDGALQAITHAIEIDAENENIEQFKQKIELELEIRSLMSLAEEQIKRNQLILPPGDNAFETYQRIAHMAPDKDKRADLGLEEIANHFFILAKKQIDESRVEELQKTIAQGLMVKPDYQPLLDLKNGSLKTNDQYKKNRTTDMLAEDVLINDGQQTYLSDGKYKVSAGSARSGLILRNDTQETKDADQQAEKVLAE